MLSTIFSSQFVPGCRRNRLIYSTRRFVLCLTMCQFVLVFFSPFCIAITSLGEERANLSALSTFVRFVLVWNCRFPLPLGAWEGLRFVIVALPGLFSYLYFFKAVADAARRTTNDAQRTTDIDWSHQLTLSTSCWTELISRRTYIFLYETLFVFRWANKP